MNKMTSGTGSLLLVAATALCLAAGCSDEREIISPEERELGEEASNSRASRLIRCEIDVAARRFACGGRGGLRGQRHSGDPQLQIVGSQGSHVLLCPDDDYPELCPEPNVAYAADTFRADVTITNLMGQAIGTPDGTTASGVRVFFHTHPTVVEGSGEVTVCNADGTEAFTGSNQPYYTYPQIIGPGETSTARTWKWCVPPTVSRFLFEVLLDADVPSGINVVYLVPADRTVRGDHAGAIANAIKHLQIFYRDELGGDLTFTVRNHPVADLTSTTATVQVHRTDHVAEWYSTNPTVDPESVWFWENVLGDGFAMTGGSFDDPTSIWIYYIDADPSCGQITGATNGVAVLPANDLRGLVGEDNEPPCSSDPPDTGSICRWVGGLGHELGHALGLPHPPGCDPMTSSCDADALMWLGFRNYPQTYLRDDEKQMLGASHFFSTLSLPGENFDCSQLTVPIAVSPDLIDLGDVPQGTSPADTFFTIRTSGDGILDWTVEGLHGVVWIFAGPSAGTVVGATQADTVWLNFNTADLPVGNYSESFLVFDAAASNSPVPLNVYINVVPPPEGAPTWEQALPSGQQPPQRREHAAARILIPSVLTVIGGSTASGVEIDTWLLIDPAGYLGGTWLGPGVTGTPPEARSGHSVVYDPTNNRAIVFGGLAADGSSVFNDVWVLTDPNLAAQPNWIQLAPTGTPPSARHQHSAVYDVDSDRMIVFGGQTERISEVTNDAWVLTNASGVSGSPAWIQLAPTGAPPGARLGHSAVYDSDAKSMIVFAGEDFSQRFDDTWVLVNADGLGGSAQWLKLAPSGGGPPPRAAHTAVLDEATDRMLVFGGVTAAGRVADLWMLEAATGMGTPAWTEVSPAGTGPSARSGHVAAYYPAWNAMVVVGRLGCQRLVKRRMALAACDPGAIGRWQRRAAGRFKRDASSRQEPVLAPA